MASLPAARHLARLVGTSDSRKALRVGAQIYINFMSLTRRSGWLQGHISKQAARDPTKADRARRALLTAAERHLTFADLFSGRGARAVPTRDISVMWCADLLRPQSSIAGRLEDPNSTAWYDHQQHRLLQSGTRFERAAKWRWFRRPEQGARATTALRRFDADGSGIVSRDERDLALAGWQADYDATARAFERSTGTRYRHPPGTLPTDPERLRSWATWWVDLQARVHITPPQERTAERSAKAAQLADAVASQASFVGRVLALGPRIVTDEWIDRAITRYGQFLDLARRDPGATLVPTLDIDLIWHVHMLSPRDYRDDCEQMLGRLLTHDDQKSDKELAGAFEATSEMWAAAHGGTPYVWRANHVDHRHYAFCGSCGWGEELFHSNLGHLEVEATQVEAIYGSSDAPADGGLAEPEPWATDAPAPDVAEDPWAAPASATDSEDYWWSSDSSSDTGGSSSWGWGSSDSSDSSCGSGCGGD